MSSIAFLKGFTPASITSGFKKAGIFPVNVQPFTDDDFLSSMPSDRQAPPNESQLQSRSLSDSHDDTRPQSVNHQTIGLPSVTNLMQHEPLSPAEVRPFPQAPNQNGSRKSRKRKSSILTDDSDSVPQNREAMFRNEETTLNEPSTSGISRFHTPSRFED